MGGLEKGEQVEVHGAVDVGQRQGRGRSVINGGHVDAASCHQPSAESHAFGGVMVAADEKNLQVLRGQAYQKVVQQGNRFGRGDRLIVNIAGNVYAVGRFPVDVL